MKIRTAGRHTREGFKNLFRNGWMTFASISAVAVTLLILGIAIILTLNIQNLSTNIENQLQINAYVSDSVPATALKGLEQELFALQGVRSIKFISKAQALLAMKKQLQQNSNLLDGLGNPLPNEFVIQAIDPSQTVSLAQAVKATPGIQNVQYGQSYINKFLAVISAVRDAAFIFIIVLLVMGVFLISNTIKITIFTRRREIEIMKLVGATDGFIRGPFFVEGTLMGIVGALVPALILNELYQWLVTSVTPFPPFSFLPLAFVMQRTVIVLILCGVFMGLWGSIVSVRRFLRV
nr:ABC transporter permease [Bacilli bacterium]